MITKTNALVSPNESTANADIIVPKIPTNRHLAFLQRHFCNAVCGNKAEMNRATKKTISEKIPIPNANQAEVTIKGI